MQNRNDRTRLQRRARRLHSRSGAYTLLEIILVLALMSLILVGLSSVIRLFSRNYSSNERRVGRAQLARSISQMLADDLGAAVQDPISAVDNDPTRQYVRHFGLRGDSRSLQIDVVQSSSFTPVADADENRRVMAGGDKSPNMRQVPELKTVFYEFVPINETQELPGEAEEDSPFGATSGTDLGSTLSGSLAWDAGAANAGLTSEFVDVSNLFWDGMRPLTQKFGLSRRELDYETPETDDEETSPMTAAYGMTDVASADVSHLSGSLASTPDINASTLAGAAGSAVDPLGFPGMPGDAVLNFDPPLTAVQIAMDSDDGTTWAPEVLDCRFRYFDGTEWFDSWDSLEKNGLPVAIKVELKLSTLDDIDRYRSSPMLLALPQARSVKELNRLATLSAEESSDDLVNSSRLMGTLTGEPGASYMNEPIDVFNSYLPPTSIMAAMRGVPYSSKLASPYARTIQSPALADQSQTPDLEDSELVDDAAFSSGLVGSLGNTGDLGMATDDVGGTLSSSYGTTNSGDAFLDQAQELEASGAIFNEAGVCVDYSNDGTYVTIEEIARELGVSEPTFYEVIAYLPTTPFSRAKTIARREPTTIRPGRVAVQTPDGSPRNTSPGRNPYATGTTRAPRERQINERTANERRPRENQMNERNVVDRMAANRGGPVERTGQERMQNERNQLDRNVASRTARERNVGTRIGRGDPLSDANSPPLGVEIADVNPAPPGPNDSAVNAGQGARPNQPSTAVGGGLGGVGGATNLGNYDPFEIVNQTDDVVPFADNAFSAIDAALNAGGTAPGMIADPTGAQAAQTPNPTTPNPRTQPPRQQQTWIRGNK